jgi:hypothetical protein
MFPNFFIYFQANFLLAHKNTIEVCHYVLHEKCQDNFLESSCGNSFKVIVLKPLMLMGLL